MKFGDSWDDVKKQSSGGAGGSFIKYPKEKTTRIRIIDEPEPTPEWAHGWRGWWEHFDQSKKKAYPCTGNRDSCPGCLSPDERTSKATRRVGFNVIMEKNGKFYVDYFKVTRKTAEKLENRAKQKGTITDRDYTLVKLESVEVTDYDVIDEDPNPIDLTKYRAQRKNPDAMLEAAFDEAWGDGAAANAEGPTESTEETGSTPDPEIDRMKEKLREHQSAQAVAEHQESFEKGSEEPPPSEPEAESDPPAEGAGEDEEQDPGEPVLGMDELEAMTKGQLMSLIATEQKWGRLPKESVSNMKKADMLQWMLDNSQ